MWPVEVMGVDGSWGGPRRPGWESRGDREGSGDGKNWLVELRSGDKACVGRSRWMVWTRCGWGGRGGWRWADECRVVEVRRVGLMRTVAVEGGRGVGRRIGWGCRGGQRWYGMIGSAESRAGECGAVEVAGDGVFRREQYGVVEVKRADGLMGG